MSVKHPLLVVFIWTPPGWGEKTNKHLSVLSRHSPDRKLLWTSLLIFPLSHLAVIWESTLHCFCMGSCANVHICVHLWVCIQACLHACVWAYVCTCVCVCLHVSKTQHDLVSGKGLGSPGPVHSRPDSSAELINISLQSKVGSATRPQGCTNWWKLTAG